MSKHALLSPSAAHRWLECTAAPRFESKFPDESSDAADEGTLAHEICATMLNNLKVDGRYGKDDFFEIIMRADNFNKYYSEEMYEYCESYANYVYGKFLEARENTRDAELIIETRVDASEFGPGLAGTTDAAIISDEGLHIFDFKYGKGVRVIAEGNPQMKIYALGALSSTYFAMYDLEDVKMTIYQPRMNNIGTFESTATELRKWGETVLKTKAKEAYGKNGKFNAGPWCQFCKGKATCAELANRNLSEVETGDPDELDDKQIADIVKRAKDIQSWLKAVETAALKRMQDGNAIAGLKLVEGRSVRKYGDEKAIINTLHKSGFDDSQILVTSLKGITDMQKTITKKVFEALLSPYIIKPAGAPTVVSEDDPRPAINSADEDFKNVEL